jgi:hypothetical protein
MGSEASEARSRGGGPQARRVGVAPRVRRQRENSTQPHLSNSRRPHAYFPRQTLIPSYL